MIRRLNQLLTGRAWSLRSMLLMAMVAFTLLAWLAGGLITAQLAQRTETELRHRSIQQLAQLLMGLSDHELEEIGPNASLLARVAMGQADTAVLQDDYRFQIWSDDGELLLGNFGAAEPAAMARFRANGFSTMHMDGQNWRVFSLHNASGRKQIQIAERERSALAIWSAVDASVLALVAASLALVLLPALWVLRRLLQPIGEMAHALEGRNPDSLAPLPTGTLPREVAPVVEALNRLFGRLDGALQRERAFTGVAAHEMRTPLAAIRVLAQVVRAADTFVERDDALDRLLLGTDRCAHLLDQLLTLQRLDASTAQDFDEPVDTTEVVMDAIAAVRADAQRREVVVSAQLDGSTIRGHRFGLLTLLRNLVSNGVNYTPAGGRVEISTHRDDKGVSIVVDDSGLGIAPADYERAFGRFQRLGAKSGAGVGLGLSIVRAVADAHGATLQLGPSPLGGLRVTVHFTGRSVGELADLLSAPPESLPAGVDSRLPAT